MWLDFDCIFYYKLSEGGMNLNSKKVWFLGYALCCLSPYVYDQLNQNGGKDTDTMVIVNNSGTLVNLTIIPEFDCPGKGKVKGTPKITKVFDGNQETISFNIPADKQNCSVSYNMRINMKEWGIDEKYVLTENINNYQYQIYDGRQADGKILKAIPWPEVRPGVIVQGVR